MMSSETWRIGFEHPSVKAEVWNRYPGSIPIVASAAPFAFGQVVALATDMKHARLIAKAPEMREMLVSAISYWEDDSQSERRRLANLAAARTLLAEVDGNG